MKKSTSSKTKEFTLVERLLVIAINAILIATPPRAVVWVFLVPFFLFTRVIFAQDVSATAFSKSTSPDTFIVVQVDVNRITLNDYNNSAEHLKSLAIVLTGNRQAATEWTGLYLDKLRDLIPEFKRLGGTSLFQFSSFPIGEACNYWGFWLDEKADGKAISKWLNSLPSPDPASLERERSPFKTVDIESMKLWVSNGQANSLNDPDPDFSPWRLLRRTLSLNRNTPIRIAYRKSPFVIQLVTADKTRELLDKVDAISVSVETTPKLQMQIVITPGQATSADELRNLMKEQLAEASRQRKGLVAENVLLALLPQIENGRLKLELSSVQLADITKLAAIKTDNDHKK